MTPGTIIRKDVCRLTMYRTPNNITRTSRKSLSRSKKSQKKKSKARPQRPRRQTYRSGSNNGTHAVPTVDSLPDRSRYQRWTTPLPDELCSPLDEPLHHRTIEEQFKFRATIAARTAYGKNDDLKLNYVINDFICQFRDNLSCMSLFGHELLKQNQSADITIWVPPSVRRFAPPIFERKQLSLSYHRVLRGADDIDLLLADAPSQELLRYIRLGAAEYAIIDIFNSYGEVRVRSSSLLLRRDHPQQSRICNLIINDQNFNVAELTYLGSCLAHEINLKQSSTLGTQCVIIIDDISFQDILREHATYVALLDCALVRALALFYDAFQT